MIEERRGWYVVNVREARWFESPATGKRCFFELHGPFPQTGVRIAVLEPGQPNGLYHRENAQEDFLVLSGECLLLANGEERRLGAWDYVHCPPGVSHIFVGAGDGPCVVLMVGHRPQDHELYYPHHEVARRHGAQAPEPTADAREAYRNVERPHPIPPPPWPV